MDRVKDGVTGEWVEKFTTETSSCMCCRTRYHIYMFPLNRTTGERQKKICIACKRDCRGYKNCQLGRLWDH